LNLAISGNTSFTTKLGAGGGLTGKIKANKTYTVFVEGYHFGFWKSLASCYGVAKPGKDGGVLGSLGSPLKDLSDSGATGYDPLEIFIYAGQVGGSKC
jgi:hypothetical protein